MRPFPLAVVSLAGVIVLAACGSTASPDPMSSGSGGGSSGEGSSESSGGTLPPLLPPLPKNPFAAPHPALPESVRLGGPVIKAPKVYPIYFANDDPGVTASLTDFVSKLGASSFWKATMEEYGVSAMTMGRPIQLSEAAPAMTRDSELQALLKAKINAKDPAFPAPDDNTIYAFFYPKGTSIVLDIPGEGGTSCASFASYHLSTTLDAQQGGRSVPYIMIPRCGFAFGFTGIDAVTLGASHELIEAANDPYPYMAPAYFHPDLAHFYWMDALGGAETADLCALSPKSYVKDPEIGYVVQRSWSNRNAAASNDPCVPSIAGQPYFNSVPALPDTVSYLWEGQMLMVSGVKIPVGEQRKIEVDLFSDRDTGGPWTVEALDFSGLSGASGALGLQLDKDSGKNGDKLSLNIAALKATPTGSAIFILRSTLGEQRTFWAGLVGN